MLKVHGRSHDGLDDSKHKEQLMISIHWNNHFTQILTVTPYYYMNNGVEMIKNVQTSDFGKSR